MELFHVIIIPLVIKAGAALRPVATLHAVVLCKPVQADIGNQATVAQAALTTAAYMDGNLNGVIAVHAGIRLVSVAAAKSANQDVQIMLQPVCVY